MKRFNLGALLLAVFAEIVLLVTSMPYFIWILGADYQIIYIIDIIVKIVAFLAVLALAKEYDKEFKFAKIMAFISAAMSLTQGYVIQAIYFASFITYDQISMALSVYKISLLVVNLLLLSAIARGVYSLLNKSGIKSARFYSMTVLIGVVIASGGAFAGQLPIAGELIILVFTAIFGIILKINGVEQTKYADSSYNKGMNNSRHDMQSQMQSQTGRSTRDEVYKQFEE